MSRIVSLMFAALLGGVVVAAHAGTAAADGHSQKALASGSAPAPAPASEQSADSDDNEGSQLWSQNCGMCHNKRSPEKYSDAQWDVIVHHMRVRANLSGEEQRKIVSFLKSANG